MTPVEVIREVYGAGFRIRAEGGNLMIRPAGQMPPALRKLLVEHKPELLEFLREAEQTAAEVIEAAMRACDHWGDDDKARQEMADDIVSIPPDLWPDLLEHLRQSYGGGAC